MFIIFRSYLSRRIIRCSRNKPYFILNFSYDGVVFHGNLPNNISEYAVLLFC